MKNSKNLSVMAIPSEFFNHEIYFRPTEIKVGITKVIITLSYFKDPNISQNNFCFGNEI